MYQLNHETHLVVIAWVSPENVKDHAVVLLGSEEPTEGEVKLVAGWLEDTLRNGAKKVTIEQHHLNGGIEVNL